MHFILITFLDGTGSLQEQHQPQQEGERGVATVHGGWGHVCRCLTARLLWPTVHTVSAQHYSAQPNMERRSVAHQMGSWDKSTLSSYEILKSVYQYLTKL